MIDAIVTLANAAAVALVLAYAATIGVVLALRHTRRPPNG